MQDDKQPATRKDVGEVVGEIVGDALQLISARFDNVETTLTEHGTRLNSLEASNNRIENKLDATIDLVDQHSIVLEQLQQKAA